MVRSLTDREILGLQNWLRSKHEQSFEEWQESNR